MPNYEYECKKCGNRFEIRQSANDDPLTRCQEKGCRGTLKKVIHPVGIIFKGSGWYITDSGRNGNGTSNNKKKSDSNGSESSKSSESSTTKDETKAPAATTAKD